MLWGNFKYFAFMILDLGFWSFLGFLCYFYCGDAIYLFFHDVWIWIELNPFPLTCIFAVLFSFSMIWRSQIHNFGSINLKGIQADNPRNIVPPSSRSSSNYVALRFCDFNSDAIVRLYFFREMLSIHSLNILFNILYYWVKFMWIPVTLGMVPLNTK